MCNDNHYFAARHSTSAIGPAPQTYRMETVHFWVWQIIMMSTAVDPIAAYPFMLMFMLDVLYPSDVYTCQ